ncbi:bifunctional DNA primase/polymerase [Nocardia sp. CA-135398]|uniref:bifunctional DNA primase/polymerase n=1 Tax=Nocardia sp. CA-135398 TaxID=3239977 RepID=UPI003D97437A
MVDGQDRVPVAAERNSCPETHAVAGRRPRPLRLRHDPRLHQQRPPVRVLVVVRVALELTKPHENLSRPAPPTLTIATPAGWHLYYRAPHEPLLRCTVARIGQGIDSRRHGGYIVAPRSLTPHGDYAVAVNRAVADLPDMLLQRIIAPPPTPPPIAAKYAEGRVARGISRPGSPHFGSIHVLVGAAACDLVECEAECLSSMSAVASACGWCRRTYDLGSTREVLPS